MFAGYGFRTEFFGDTPVGDVSIRQRILWPVKKLVVALHLMPKTTGGKKWLKKIVFGGLVKMPAEISPQIDADLKAKKIPQISQITPQRNSPDQSGIPPQYDSAYLRGGQGKQIGKDEKTLYRGCYVEPERISGREPDKVHKVIYCVAMLE